MAIVVNSSDQIISTLHLSVWGQYCEVKLLAPGGEVTCQFEGGADSSYVLSITTEDGSVYDYPSVAYVTGGVRLVHKLNFFGQKEVTVEVIDAT